MDVGDGLLVGAAEGGFCGLDEFTPIDGMIHHFSAAAATPQTAGMNSGKRVCHSILELEIGGNRKQERG